MIKTPVVFIIFNRKETTKRVFQAIRKAQPTQLLVISDAPRLHYPDDIKKCEETRNIINAVDWKCEVLTNYASVNLGIRKRLETGLNWVFQQVEEAIIFEHDCLPHPSFFPFCETLLQYYKNDNRIMHIGGNNFQLGYYQPKESYYFSHYTHIWGWATWRRAWRYYDAKMKLWEQVKLERWLEQLLVNPQTLKYWKTIFQKTHDYKIDTWDYQWTFACWLQGALSIVPSVNLVSNIGFGKEGIYTLDSDDILANLLTQEMTFPLHHPNFMIRHREADQFTQNNILQRSFIAKLKAKVKKRLKLSFL